MHEIKELHTSGLLNLLYSFDVFIPFTEQGLVQMMQRYGPHVHIVEMSSVKQTATTENGLWFRGRPKSIAKVLLRPNIIQIKTELARLGENIDYIKKEEKGKFIDHAA